MKELTSYPEIIANSDTYNTYSKPNPLLKLFPTLPFILKYLYIILYSSKEARNNIYNRNNWVYSSLDILHSLENVGVKFEISGLGNLKIFDGPAVFVANHMSTLETMVIPSLIQPVKSLIFVMKKELADMPLIGSIVTARTPIVVGRSNPREDLKLVMEEGAQNLTEGKSIIIFPQRTRSLQFNPKQFNSLGIKLAKRNKVPVIPLALLTDAWGEGKLIKDLGKIDIQKKVHFSFGKPLNIDGNGQAEHQKCLDFIISSLTAWGRADLIK